MSPTPPSAATVGWSETDASGRFHFTAPWTWVENAEHALYRSASPAIDIGRFPRRSTEATYHRALRAGDTYRVELAADTIGRSSIRFTWRILSGSDVCVEGAHTVVHVGESGEPAPVPAEIRTALLGPHNTQEP